MLSRKSYVHGLWVSAFCLGLAGLSLFAESDPLPKRFARIEVRRHQLNTLLPPYNICIEISTGGPRTMKYIRCVVLRGEIYDRNATDYRQIRKQLIPYSYTWKVMSESNTVVRSWPCAFFQNRDFVYGTEIRLPLDEFPRSVLEIYFEDIDGDGQREDVTFVVDMSEFDWSPTTGVVYQSEKRESGTK